MSHVMNGSASAQVQHIDAVDAFARTLYVRSKQAPSPTFDDVAVAVRRLHISLRHLRVEAADRDSLLYRPDSAVYLRQLNPIVEDCEFALTQLETVLDRFDAASGRPDEVLGNRIASVSKRLAQEETNIGLFLDTVQLPSHHASTSSPPPDEASLDQIQSKVDAIASRLFADRQHTACAPGDDTLWRDFMTELEKEGFSSQVLDKHKDVLRAYIRQLESVSARADSAPTMQDLLEYQANLAPQVDPSRQPPQVPPKIPIKERNTEPGNEKCSPLMKNERPMPDQAPLPLSVDHYYSFDRGSASSDDNASDLSMALISTRDLVAMDGLNASMAAMNLQNGSPSHGQRYLTSPNMPAALPAPDHDLSASPNGQLLGVSPSYYPAVPYGDQNGRPGSKPPPRLAPDRYGNEIPLDAPWTKIRRTLVSPEVLERAGVRYEARPEYVAVLGRLSRDEIAEFARQSADCRAARSARSVPRNANGHDRDFRGSVDGRNRPQENEDDVLWDESDSTDYRDDKSDKGTKSYPFIVSPPDKKTSPASTVKPKPILKNKNEKTVRFDPEPHEVEHPDSAPSSYRDDRRRDYDGGRRHRDRHDRQGANSSSWRTYRDSGPSNGHRDRRDRDRDRRHDRRDERAIKKKTWGETLGAVGIGGAAVSLISVLAEAASAV